MNRYRLTITEGHTLGRDIIVDAETATEARLIAKEEHPTARIGTAFRQGEMPGVPRKRAGNSRYRMKDTGKMPDVDPGLASNRRGRRG